jgi:hypothetical protein
MDSPAVEVALEAPYERVILPPPITIDRERIFVNPPTLHLGSGSSRLKTIQWVNQTGGEVLIWLPNAYNYLEGNPGDFLLPKSIPVGRTLTFAVSPDCKDGYYHYNVFCKRINGYAEGNSEPGVSCP